MQDIAAEYIETWQHLSLSQSDDPFVIQAYGSSLAAWTLPDNLYMQILFRFDLLNTTVGHLLCFTGSL